MDHRAKKRKLGRTRVERFRAVRRLMNSKENSDGHGLNRAVEQHEPSTSKDSGHEFIDFDHVNLAAEAETVESDGTRNIDAMEGLSDENILSGSEVCDAGNVDESDIDPNDYCDQEMEGNRNIDWDDAAENVSDDSSDEDYMDEDLDDIEALRQWAIDSNIPHTRLDNLLRILRRKFPQLPKSSKTFLKTSSAVYDIKKMRDTSDNIVGEFVYFGLTQNLQRCVNTELHEENILELQFNIDGLPLFESSHKQFWPILCRIHFDPDVYKVFPVAVYSGFGKPDNLEEYLSNFIEELNEAVREGIEINGRIFKVNIKCFVCDRPARSMIKCMKGHGGYYACERCTIRGERSNKRTVYISPDCDERTDMSFRNQDQPEHHTGVTPLTSILTLNMITHFVLDFMHLGCLGIMKKLLLDIWLGKESRFKLSQGSRYRLSQILISLQPQVPQDFQRTTRSLSDTSKWKATEFRFFLLYSGPVVLKNILHDEAYKHFLLLHVAFRILSSEDLALKFYAEAKVYLRSFVLLSRDLYGDDTQILNMHSLIHVADDVRNMKTSLSKITAFPFENALGKMKKVLRSGNRPLSQLCRRLHEAFFANEEVVVIPSAITILTQRRLEPSGRIIIKRLRYKEAILSSSSPNNTVTLKNGLILNIDVIYILPNDEDSCIYISGRISKPMSPIFTYPCNSKTLNMWKVVETRIRKNFKLSSVAYKMVHLEIEDSLGGIKSYVIPLLHQQ